MTQEATVETGQSAADPTDPFAAVDSPRAKLFVAALSQVEAATPSELCQWLGESRLAALSVLDSLDATGLVERDGGRYRLTRRARTGLPGTAQAGEHAPDPAEGRAAEGADATAGEVPRP